MNILNGDILIVRTHNRNLSEAGTAKLKKRFMDEFESYGIKLRGVLVLSDDLGVEALSTRDMFSKSK